MMRRCSSLLLAFGMVACCERVGTSHAWGQAAWKPLRAIRWQALEAPDQSGVDQVDSEPETSGQPPADAWHLRGNRQGSATLHVATLDGTGLGPPGYVLRGRVKCRGVDGAGYFELWSRFPDGSAFFTRGLAPSGPLGQLLGDQDWRAVELPFWIEVPRGRSPSDFVPRDLVLNLVLPNGGDVWLSDFELARADAPAATSTSSAVPTVARAEGAWWNTTVANWLVALGGAVFGSLVLVVGFWGAAGRGRRLVERLLAAGIVVGLGCALAGAVAWLAGQGGAVVLPLLLWGLVTAGCSAGMWPVMRGQYAARELRRMQALDVI